MVIAISLRQGYNRFQKVTSRLGPPLDRCLVISRKEQCGTGRQQVISFLTVGVASVLNCDFRRRESSVVPRRATGMLHQCTRSSSFRMVLPQRCYIHNIHRPRHYNHNIDLNDPNKEVIIRRLQRYRESR